MVLYKHLLVGESQTHRTISADFGRSRRTAQTQGALRSRVQLVNSLLVLNKPLPICFPLCRPQTPYTTRGVAGGLTAVV